MTTADELWNDITFCHKRWREQIAESNRIILAYYAGKISEENKCELLESVNYILKRFGNRITELTPQPN